MYRVARNYPNLVTVHDWRWYINQAVLTISTLTGGGVGFVNDGLMGETVSSHCRIQESIKLTNQQVIKYLLTDLQREGLTANATLVQSRMMSRWRVWTGERFPYVFIFVFSSGCVFLITCTSQIRF